MSELNLDNVNRLLATGMPDKAVEMCRGLFTREDMREDANLWFAYGKALWMLQRRPEAEMAFRRALELNPESPAKVALEFCEDITSFFNPDLLNP